MEASERIRELSALEGAWDGENVFTSEDAPGVRHTAYSYLQIIRPKYEDYLLFVHYRGTRRDDPHMSTELTILSYSADVRSYRMYYPGYNSRVDDWKSDQTFPAERTFDPGVRWTTPTSVGGFAKIELSVENGVLTGVWVYTDRSGKVRSREVATLKPTTERRWMVPSS